MTDLVLTPAACYPVYPAIASRGALPAGGATVDAGGAYVFRHEPSEDPARLQMFHQREIVRIGEPHIVRAWRDAWRERALELLGEIGLDVQLDLASDPFFGRRGRMLDAQPARAGAEVRGADSDRRARSNRGGVVQLPPGPLRFDLRPHAAQTEPRRTPPAWGSAWSGSRSLCWSRTGSTSGTGRPRWAADYGSDSPTRRGTRQPAGPRPRHLSPPHPARAGTDVRGNQLLHRHPDRAAPRPRAGAAGGDGMHAADGLRGRSVDVLQACARRPRDCCSASTSTRCSPTGRCPSRRPSRSSRGAR